MQVALAISAAITAVLVIAAIVLSVTLYTAYSRLEVSKRHSASLLELEGRQNELERQFTSLQRSIAGNKSVEAKRGRKTVLDDEDTSVTTDEQAAKLRNWAARGGTQ